MKHLLCTLGYLQTIKNMPGRSYFKYRIEQSDGSSSSSLCVCNRIKFAGANSFLSKLKTSVYFRTCILHAFRSVLTPLFKCSCLPAHRKAFLSHSFTLFEPGHPPAIMTTFRAGRKINVNARPVNLAASIAAGPRLSLPARAWHNYRSY